MEPEFFFGAAKQNKTKTLCMYTLYQDAFLVTHESIICCTSKSATTSKKASFSSMAGGVDISSSSSSLLKQPVQQVHATHDGNEVKVSQLMASVPFDDPFLKNRKQRRNAFAPIPTTEHGVLFQNPAAGQPSMANSFETPIDVDGGANVLPWHSSVSAHGNSDPASHPPSNNTSHP
jgi:hypothetical protein